MHPACFDSLACEMKPLRPPFSIKVKKESCESKAQARNPGQNPLFGFSKPARQEVD